MNEIETKLDQSTTDTNLLAAYEAGVKASTPVEQIPGVIAAHQDIVLRDYTDALHKHERQTKPGPKNVDAFMQLHTQESFITAVNEYARKETKIYSDRSKFRIIAVIDGVFAENDRDAEIPQSGWGNFKLRHCLNQSRKLKEWESLQNLTSQEAFANFLEDHMEDVREPAASDLLAIAKDLQAAATGHFKGRVNTQSGATRLSFSDEMETNVEVPKEIKLGIPLFEDGKPYALKARLIFRAQRDGLKFALVFPTLADAVEQEFERITQEIDEAVDPVVFSGSCEM